MHEHQIETEHPIEVIAWTNEEGARFSPAMRDHLCPARLSPWTAAKWSIPCRCGRVIPFYLNSIYLIPSRQCNVTGVTGRFISIRF
nr:hypothetical protein [Pontibacterium sinense]